MAAPVPESADALNQQASARMKAGIALLEKNTPQSLKEAIAHFDQAIAWREGLPPDNPLFRYGLAAGWINRADALARLGSEQDLMDALRSYDNAIEVMQALPLDENLLFRRRLAIAWSNRGLALQVRRHPQAFAQAESSFRNAIDLLTTAPAHAITDRDYLLAAAYVNCANTLTHHPDVEAFPSAITMAKQAIALADQSSQQDMYMAEISLKARHAVCRAVAGLLAQSNPDKGAQKEWVNEATDAADEGLTLVKLWHSRGEKRFDALGRDLFYFGAGIYQHFQPQFYREFVAENPGWAAP
jgi:tetratricopeptide (TPR) repeat protein